MYDLPTNLSWWEPWDKELRERIKAANATDSLTALIKAGCKEEQLLFRLAAVVAWKQKDHPSRKTTGLTLHRLKMAPKKLREAAELVKQLESWHRPDDEIPKETDALIASLNSYASELEQWKIPALLHPSRVTLETAALCCLVAYVEHATAGKKHDHHLSALIAAVLGRDNYCATHLTQWRSKHRKHIEENRSVLVIPQVYSIPKK